MRGRLLTIVLAAVLAGQTTIGQARAGSLASLVEAERAFAKLSAKLGQLPAFLAYFADDVVTFRPLPAGGKDALREAAVSAPNPSVRLLDWEPWFAGIARAGDLGYTTGPSVVTDLVGGKVLRRGWYFSVWRHDEYGWRVVADIGVEAPGADPPRPSPLTVGAAAPGAASDTRASIKQPWRAELAAAERELCEKLPRSGAAAYRPYLTPSARFYRDGVGAVVGAEGILRFLSDKPLAAGCRAVQTIVSSSGDLAYSYGFYDLPASASETAATSSFLRVWQAGPSGWLLAAEVVNVGQ